MVRGLVVHENCFGANGMNDIYCLQDPVRERQAHCLLGELNPNAILTKTTTTTRIYQSYSQSQPYNKDWKKYLSERVRAAVLVGSNVLIVLFYFVVFSFPNYLNQRGAYVIDH